MEKLAAAIARGEFSMEKALEDTTKMLEDIKNGNVTFIGDVAPTVTYKKRRKIIRDDK